MGAWGTGPFENDDATDWALDLQDAADEGPAFVQEFIERVVNWPKDGYIDASECTVAISAAEIVASMRGNRPEKLPEAAEAWLKGQSQPEPKLVTLAITAVDRILANSELADIWSEAEPDDAKEWRANCASLLTRLKS